MKYDYVLKIILVGNSNTGKSNFFNLLLNNEIDEPTSTIGVDFSIIYHTINDKVFRINLWDTAGQERFYCIIDRYFREISGVILFFDINNINSFYSLEKWITKIKDQNKCNHDHPIILLGNKNDLPNKVNHNDIIDLINKYDLIYIETSLKQNKIIVYDILELIIDKINLFYIKNKKNIICQNIKLNNEHNYEQKNKLLITYQNILNNKSSENKDNNISNKIKNKLYHYTCFI